MTGPVRNRSTRAALFGLVTVAMLASAVPAAGLDVLTSGKHLAADISAVHGRIAIDLDGSIWVLPENGGRAMRLAESAYPLAQPRWAPDGGSILYQARTAEASQLWLVGIGTRQQRQLSKPGHHDQDGSWHPDGQRIVFASDRHGNGLDLWEMDLPTGLEWRLSDYPGDESQPAWSANGRHLAFIHSEGANFALMVRRHGEPDRVVVEGEDVLAAPSWRPDGSLLTYYRMAAQGPVLEMVILSDPPIVRIVEAGEALEVFPVSWRNRMKLLYTANGELRTRGFEQRRSRPLHFRAVIENKPTPAPRTVVSKTLQIRDPADTPIVVRAARLLDGLGSRYRENVDILIEEGRISAIEESRSRDDSTVLDLGNVTVMPGLIDTWSRAVESPTAGAAILAYGVTTIVAEDGELDFDPAVWESETTPGPRLLPAVSWTSALSPDVDERYFLVNLGSTDELTALADAATRWRDAGVPLLAASPSLASRTNSDFLLGASHSSIPPQHALISALADADTPGIEALLASRQALTLGHTARPVRHLAEAPGLGAAATLVAAGSRPNGLPPGLGLHAELRALGAAGLNGEQVLNAATRNAARLLGLENQLGVVLPGAAADLLLIAGDPLSRPAEALKIVAVVRNGRFFSLVSLLERARAPVTVE